MKKFNIEITENKKMLDVTQKYGEKWEFKLNPVNTT